MSLRAEHYKKAEAIISELEKIDERLSGEVYLDPQQIININATREYLMKRAELHALLAGAAVEGDDV